MNRILSVVVAAAFAGAMPAVQAQSIPTMEACAKYAEADVVFESAQKEAGDVYVAAWRAAGDAFQNKRRTARETAGDNYVTVVQEASAVYDAATKKASAAKDTAIEDARTVLTQTYLAIYAEGGGMQSDVWDVMVKLLTHQRELCTEQYGL